METDDPYDCLLSGTKIAGSCQRVDGSPNLNKALVGYLLNGETRLITVKDKSGKIVARSVFCLLWDGTKPILLQEKIYNNLGSSLDFKHPLQTGPKEKRKQWE